MTRKLLAIIAILFFAAGAKATHIVGGEFELVHISGFQYKLRLIQYFDVVNGNPGAEDQSVVAFIFANDDITFLTRTVVLFLVEKTLVEYSQPECAIGELVTRRLVYETTITLEPESYNDPDGYHVVFERCCRNNVITNVFLPFPNSVGQTWTLDFPPVVDEEGNPFINSSPILFPPLSDYACVNDLYYFDFSGFDPDGDSIAYSLVTPYNSSSLQAFPNPQPKPHTDIPWANGIGIENVIPGNPVLNTTVGGFLSVNPSFPGLYVFALLGEEYRDGVKIGEVRRDFQMLVLDCGGPTYTPEISIKKKSEDEFHDESKTLTFTAGEEKCFELIVTDLNSFDADNSEDISIHTETLNFNADITQILNDSSGVLNNMVDTLKFEVCLPDCPFLVGEAFRIRFTAEDNTCPLALVDTVDLGFFIEPPPTQQPFYVKQDSTVLNPTIVIDTLREGDIFSLDILGRDLDYDTLILWLDGENFDPEDYDMSLEVLQSDSGWIQGVFTWDTGCGVNNYGLFSDFKINIVLDDLDQCLLGPGDTLDVNIHVILPSNTDPVVTTSSGLSTDLEPSVYLEVEIGDQIGFDVMVADADLDYVFLNGFTGGSFNFDSIGMSFEDVEDQTSTASPFSWNVDCDIYDPESNNEFPVLFIGTDIDTCKLPNADTLRVIFKIKDPVNVPPRISFTQLQNTNISVKPGSTVELDLEGVDDDNDFLNLDLSRFIGTISRDQFNFNATNGIGTVLSTFSWETSCSLYSDSIPTDNIFAFQFLISDDYCVNPNKDSIILQITLEDPTADYENFAPPNVFTPNGDNFNDTFFIPDLPVDNCDAQFERITIYNRWGREVFFDSRRDFEWDGDQMAAGVYYYHIKYSNGIEYNGIVSILF